jgi:PAS domain S-box-containing protein
MLMQNACFTRQWGDHLGLTPGQSGFSPEVIAQWRRNNRRVLRGQPVREIEHVQSQGRRLVLDTLATPFRRDGRIVGILGFLIDVTEQRRGQEALREAEERYRLAADATGVATWRTHVRPDGTFWTEGNVERLLGYRREKVGDWFARVPPAARPAVAKAWREVLTGRKRVFHLEHPIRHRTGRLLWFEVHGRVVRGANGRVSHIIGATRDITRRKRAEGSLRALAAQLEDRVAARTAALSRLNRRLEAEVTERKRLEQQMIEVSERHQRRIGQDLHDSLGQQLAGIAFLLGALSHTLSHRACQEATEARRIGGLLQETIRQVRTLSRGLHPVAPDGHGLADALEDLADTVRTTYRIPCRVQVARTALCRTERTAVNLYRIAQEAVHNAVRHGKPRTIHIRLAPARSGLRLTVTDDGVGLPVRLGRRKGVGIPIMQHRAASLGARLAITRGARGGTVVRCDAPADRPA